MRKLVILSMVILTAGIGCGKKSGGGSSSPNYNNGWYNNGWSNPNYSLCSGFDGNTATPFRRQNNGKCIDMRNKTPVQSYFCDNGGWAGNGFQNGINGGWAGNGFQNGGLAGNGFRANCNPINQNQFGLNFYYQGACQNLNTTPGYVWMPVVFPNLQQTICVEYRIVSNFVSQYQFSPMTMTQYPGAYIGCIPGTVVPGCRCVGAGGAGIGLYVGAGFGPWGFSAGIGAGAGSSAGICYPY